MENHERAVVKAAIMQSLCEEVDKWLDKQPAISSGYDYEVEFLKTSRSVNKIILEKVWESSLAAVMIKKNTNLLWKNSYQQKTCAL